MRLLLVEDEESLRDSLKTRLMAEGFAVDEASDGPEGLYFATEFPIDLAIVDLGLPGFSGMKLIEQVREQGHTFPILILTARGNWEDKVAGLEAGADDYLVKPFVVEELLARVNALVRRSAGWAQAVLKSGPIELNSKTQEVKLNGESVELTSFEYKVVEYLMMHAGEVISKARLTDHIYQQDFDRDSNVIEVFIGRLRKKLDPNNEHKPIETLRGRGYRFKLVESASAT